MQKGIEDGVKMSGYGLWIGILNGTLKNNGRIIIGLDLFSPSPVQLNWLPQPNSEPTNHPHSFVRPLIIGVEWSELVDDPRL